MILKYSKLRLKYYEEAITMLEQLRIFSGSLTNKFLSKKAFISEYA